MKHIKQKLKRGAVLFLSSVLLAGIIPGMPGSIRHVQASVGESTPSVTAFATSGEMMDTFSLAGRTDENNNVIITKGKIVFGKDSAGNPLEWYILGKDEGVNGNNTVIFAASPIKNNFYFNYFKSPDEDKVSGNIYAINDLEENQQSLFGSCIYGNESKPTSVYRNHYGVSRLRGELESIAEDSNYFTQVEQSLMNETTVTTSDTYNNKNYTTTDKLYALLGTNGGDTIYGGSGGNVGIPRKYLTETSIWLRSPGVLEQSLGGLAQTAKIYATGSADVALQTNSIQPASNLNLSSVLFASAARAASLSSAESGTIAEGTAMTLRLNGINKSIGTVIYDADTNEGHIVAQKDVNATGTVSLVVQGKGTIGGVSQDWYYSVPVEGTIVVTAEQIKTALSLEAAPSLGSCKIWLETTENHTAYAKLAKENAIPVTITGTDASITYTGATIDVSKYFTIDGNAGAVTYSIITGDGAGTLKGTILTVTKTGIFRIKVSTAANGIYAAGEKTITLTVANGVISYTTAGYSGTYDGKPHGITVNVTKPADTTVTYSTDGTTYSTENPMFTGVGTYTVYYKIQKENYSTITGQKSVIIAKAENDSNTSDNTTPSTDPGITGGSWKLDNGKWWYVSEDGSYPVGGWSKIEGEWYVFDAAGYMETGWYRSGSDWYYLGSSGAMQTGWVWDGNNWYYMSASGAMQTGWVWDGNNWYYMNASGAMQTGWVSDGGTWYYMDESGAMQTGWVSDGGNWYYMDESGAMQTGWIWDGANWYYMYSNGAMAHDVVIGGYRLSASGAWVQ
ncbi:MAG: N-acetylmuramoyl-L-alanine amidase family protein [Roseburia sp.]